MKKYYAHAKNSNTLRSIKANSDEEALQKCIELLKRDKQELSAEWRAKRDKLLNDHIDVTAFLVWFAENYPESKQTMVENPDYQYRFK